LIDRYTAQLADAVNSIVNYEPSDLGDVADIDVSIDVDFSQLQSLQEYLQTLITNIVGIQVEVADIVMPPEIDQAVNKIMTLFDTPIDEIPSLDTLFPSVVDTANALLQGDTNNEAFAIEKGIEERAAIDIDNKLKENIYAVEQISAKLGYSLPPGVLVKGIENARKEYIKETSAALLTKNQRLAEITHTNRGAGINMIGTYMDTKIKTTAAQLDRLKSLSALAEVLSNLAFKKVSVQVEIEKMKIARYKNIT